MTKLLYAASLLFLVLTVSCQDTRQERTAAIDSIQGVLANVSKRTEQINPQLLEKYIKSVVDKLNEVELLDSLTDKQLGVVQEFQSLPGRFENCLKTTSEVKASLSKCRSQLMNLRKDVELGTWHTDSLNQFLETEFLYITDLDESIDEVIAQLDASFDAFEVLDSKIERLLKDTISE
jgi:hypothetical protein